MKRATVDDIRKHEWFIKDCPKYLFPDRVTDTSIVDIDAISEVNFLHHLQNLILSTEVP